jgi:hypothetical protein
LRDLQAMGETRFGGRFGKTSDDTVSCQTASL